MMTEPKIVEFVMHIRDTMMRLLEKRDIVLKLIKKNLIKLSKKKCSGIRSLKNGETSLVTELDKFLNNLIEFDVDEFFGFLHNFKSKYSEIYYREVHPKTMQREMIKFLFASSDVFCNYSKRLGELRDEVSKIHEYLKSISKVETEYSKALKALMLSIEICEQQYYESASYLRKLIKDFSIPPECPPHM